MNLIKIIHTYSIHSVRNHQLSPSYSSKHLISDLICREVFAAQICSCMRTVNFLKVYLRPANMFEGIYCRLYIYPGNISREQTNIWEWSNWISRRTIDLCQQNMERCLLWGNKMSHILSIFTCCVPSWKHK